MVRANIYMQHVIIIIIAPSIDPSIHPSIHPSIREPR